MDELDNPSQSIRNLYAVRCRLSHIGNVNRLTTARIGRACRQRSSLEIWNMPNPSRRESGMHAASELGARVEGCCESTLPSLTDFASHAQVAGMMCARSPVVVGALYLVQS